MGQRLRINGTGIFVDERGPAGGDPVLFIHGGPGNPSWDFMESVGDLLAGHGVRIIGVDQRGVGRSDVLPEEPALSVPVLIDDFEGLRESLGIPSWTIIGHSSGGAYAVDYALAHPEVIAGLILDCPALDTDATDRHRLPRAATMLEAAGMPEAAARCRELAASERRLTAEDRSWEAMTPLGDRYLDLFFADAEGRRRYEEGSDAAPDDLDWSKSWSHRPLLTDMYVDRVPLLAGLAMPSMLVHGDADLVAAPALIDAYRKATGGPVATIAHAGHFSFVERPAEYVDAVLDFIRR